MKRYMVFAHPGNGGWGFDESYTKREDAVKAAWQLVEKEPWANVLDSKTGDVVFNIESNHERILVSGL